MERWATFDCYGTLIDWNAGIARELARLWPDEDTGPLLDRYHELEPVTQKEDPARTYRDVLRVTLSRVAAEAGLGIPAEESDALARSVPRWPPFVETREALLASRERGWRLAVLSNTDRDLVESSKQRIDVPFDETIVASEIGSYKPGHRHWEEFFARTGAPRALHVHVAASLFHDIAPCSELGLRSVWINREGAGPGPEPTRELPGLTRLPETLDDLVPA